MVVGVRIRGMEVLLPASTLVVGLVLGAFSLWMLTRAERATLTERLNGKEAQLRDVSDAFDREKDEAAPPSSHEDETYDTRERADISENQEALTAAPEVPTIAA